MSRLYWLVILVKTMRRRLLLALLTWSVVGLGQACGGVVSLAELDAQASGGTNTQLPGMGGDGSSSAGTATGGKSSVGGSPSVAASDTNDTSGSLTSVCSTSPWVLVGSVPNARSLGGLPLANGATVRCDALYRGSYLTTMTVTGCEAFANLGIRSVIDLRSLGEQSSVPAACVTKQATVLSAPLPIPYNVSPEDYLADLYSATSMQTAFSALAAEASYPVYFHCHYGKDRTGVLSAVILWALGATRETIHAEYALSGTAGFAYYPESLEAVLDEIERVGGIDAYFELVGVPPEQVEAMRKLLTASTNAP